MEMIVGLIFGSSLLYLLFWKRQRNTNKKISVRQPDDFDEQYISEPVKVSDKCKFCDLTAFYLYYMCC